MWKLILVSIIWAFSFGLIKGQLSGIPPSLIASIRLMLCFLCFLPFIFRFKELTPNPKLIALGALQFGLMYLLYIQSYQYLPGYLVAVFTIFTPLYVVLINAIAKQKLVATHFIPVGLSILGAGIIVFKLDDHENAYFTGFIILQLANIAFAIGQVLYRQVQQSNTDSANMGWMYLGGVLLTTIYCFFDVEGAQISISTSQWLTLLYLGVISSGVCFYLWNKGSREVETSTLAVMNNGYVPLAVIFSMVIFSEPMEDITRLVFGSIFISLSVYLSVKVVK